MYGWPSYEECSFKYIDAHVNRAPRYVQNSVESLANYLRRQCNSELHKARAIFVWICHNITYDRNSVIKGEFPSKKPEDVLRTRSAVCDGFATLYKELADKLGLQSKYLSGYSTLARHAWNAVKIEEHWYLIDSTFGAGYVNDENEFVKKFNDFYFLCPELVFFYNHYPDDDIWLPDVWKNKNPTLGLEDWKKLLKPTPALFNAGLFNQHFRQFEYFDNFSTKESILDMYIPKSEEKLQNLDLACKLQDAHNNEIPNSVMIADGIKEIRISVIFPAQGDYKLDVYRESPKQDEDGKSFSTLSSLFSMKLNYSGLGSKESYPTVTQSFHQYFLPFETHRIYKTSDSEIKLRYPKLQKQGQHIAFGYELYKGCDEDGNELLNSAFITDDMNEVNISVVFPSKGYYKLKVFGNEANAKGPSSPLLFSLIIKNLGKGSNKKFPKTYPLFYEKAGTVIFSPLNGPLKSWNNGNEEVFFDFNLPGAIDAAILDGDGPNPQWNHLSKRSVYQNRWQGSIRVKSGDLRLSVQYEEGGSYERVLNWVDNDVCRQKCTIL